MNSTRLYKMLIGASALGAMFFATQASAANWEVDASHTNVGFSVSHLFTCFNDFDATIVFDPDDPPKTVVKGTVQAASINTDQAKRDPAQRRLLRRREVSDARIREHQDEGVVG